MINTLAGSTVVRVSDLPGLTRQINFYTAGNLFHMVDMPGYGFAFVSEEERKSWNDLVRSFYVYQDLSFLYSLCIEIADIVRLKSRTNNLSIILQMETYIANRKTLKRIFVIIDARHGESLLSFKNRRRIPVTILLTVPPYERPQNWGQGVFKDVGQVRTTVSS